MHIKSKFNSLKHFDFILLDSISLFVSFLISFSWLNEFYFDEKARFTIFTSVLLSIIINSFNNSYSGILKREFSFDLLSNLTSSLFVFISIFLSGKLLKLNISSVMLLITWLLFFLLSSIFKQA